MTTQLRVAAFLDRDGVLNYPLVRDGRPFAPLRHEDFRVYPEAPAAIARLKAAGLLTIVATNQKDVGEGRVSRATVELMHRSLIDQTGVDAVYLCTCVDECQCYKPNPGMLLQAAREWGIDLVSSFMVGDRWRDIGAGRRAGCRTLFIDRGYREALRDTPDWIVADVAEAATTILAAAARGREALGRAGQTGEIW